MNLPPLGGYVLPCAAFAEPGYRGWKWGYSVGDWDGNVCYFFDISSYEEVDVI